MAGATTSERDARTRRAAIVRIVPVIAALALGLTLSACDHCGDFFWQRPGACKSGPPPN
jgi:hypothetical protein